MMHLRALVCAIVCVAIAGLFSNADTPDKFVKLGQHAADLVVGPVMNADGYCLSDCVFSDQDLRSASFIGATLDRMRFDECNLRDASFREADLRGAFFYTCDTTNANFFDALIHKYSVSGSDDLSLNPKQLISTQSYKEKKLTSVRISGRGAPAYDFSGANLQGAVLLGGSFENSIFYNASVARTGFENCVLPFEKLILETKSGRRRKSLSVSLANVKLTGDVDFGSVELFQCRIGGIEPTYRFTDTKIGDGTSLGVLTKNQLYATNNYGRGVFRNVTFMACDFSNANLSGKNFTGCRFISCNLDGANLYDAVVTDVEFSSTKISDEQFESTWDFRERSAKLDSSSEQVFKVR